MSTPSIQPQLGYAAQASPQPAAPANAVERSASPLPHIGSAAEHSRTSRSTPAQQETGFDKKPATDQPRPESKHMTRKTDIDWTTNSLVYRVIDNRSGQVVSQSPDEALLRLRAYAKQALTQSEGAQFGALSVSREL